MAVDIGTPLDLLGLLKAAILTHVESASDFTGQFAVSYADCQAPLKLVISIWYENSFNGELYLVRM